jgi:hypothetical protein
MWGPFDVALADGVNTRRCPSSNRCEARAFAGVHIWDWLERNCLDQSVKDHKGDSPFVFLNIGANAGLYGLFVNATAKAAGNKTSINAVEPNAENRSCLTVNHQAGTNSREISK